jgi:hypothetical protein
VERLGTKGRNQLGIVAPMAVVVPGKLGRGEGQADNHCRTIKTAISQTSLIAHA